MDAPSQILPFDRALLRHRRDRAARNFASHDALFREVAERLIERLGDVKRTFTAILDLGAHDGALARALTKDKAFVVAADLSENMLRRTHTPAVAADEELLPFAENSFDLIVSNLSLHWVNDLPGALAQIRRALKPDGLFLAALPGGQTLGELGTCLMEAELATAGGASPRTAPRIDAPTASALLQRAGFALPVTDLETIILTYSDAFALMHELRGMGEANIAKQRMRRPTRRAVFMEAARIYRERFGAAGHIEARIEASFDIIFLHGWKNA